jgi:hypothetical protein
MCRSTSEFNIVEFKRLTWHHYHLNMTGPESFACDSKIPNKKTVIQLTASLKKTNFKLKAVAKRLETIQRPD